MGEGDGQQMFSKGRTGPHLGGSVLGLGGYNDPQAGASAAYSLLTKARLDWSWADKVTYLEKFRPSQNSREQDLGKSLPYLSNANVKQLGWR